MTIGTNSYGSVAEVAALTGRYTASGSYNTTTRPTLAQVEKFIDRVSGIVNTILSQLGFTVPITQADVKLMLDEFVVEQVSQLCHAANGAGPFAPGSEELRGRTAFSIITGEALIFMQANKTGMERMGAVRTYGITNGLQAHLTDESGDPIEPIFDEAWVK